MPQQIRFQTDGPQFHQLLHYGALGRVLFEVREPGRAETYRQPLHGMKTLEDLWSWMCANGYHITNQRADYRQRRGRYHHVIADVVKSD